MREKNWRIKGEPVPADGGLVNALMGIRGIGPEFFKQEGLCDPFLMKDMDRAAERIKLAVRRGERVCVYGDYDADGVSATYIMLKTLKFLSIDCFHYIPGRFEEGYGLNSQAVREIYDRGASLIITVDTGVSAAEEADLASSLGMDMIITDHHECPEDMPRVEAVVNPRRRDCEYPFKGLCGAAVAFKLSQAMIGEEIANEMFIGFVAIGTVADAMPLTGENREMVKAGLKWLEETDHPGIRELISQSGLKGKRLSAASIGFGLSPRINAAGRMENAEAALSLFLCEDGREAFKLCGELCRLNALRQQVEGDISNECIAALEEARFSPATDGMIVLAGEGWHSGVIGIVAARLAERYCCPALLISLENGVGRGSGRSVEDFTLYEALNSARPLLARFGGHAMAVGLTVDEANIDALKDTLKDYSLKIMPPGGYKPTIDIDLEVSPQEITLENARALTGLEPYGEGNPRPLFVLRDLRAGDIREVGGRHSKFQFSCGGKSLEGILFGTSPCDIASGQSKTFDVAFELDINDFGRTERPQLIIRDIKPCRADREAFEDQLGLFGGLLSGERLDIADLAGAVPDRKTFAEVWRGLSAIAQNGSLSADIRTLCPDRGERGLLRFLICVGVFGELELLQYALDGFYITAFLSETSAKVDLNDSKLLKSVLQMVRGEDLQ